MSHMDDKEFRKRFLEAMFDLFDRLQWNVGDCDVIWDLYTTLRDDEEFERAFIEQED